MRHAGKELDDRIVAIGRRVIAQQTFTLNELRGELKRAGAGRPTYLAQRFLQAERKAGRIEHVWAGELSYWRRTP